MECSHLAPIQVRKQTSRVAHIVSAKTQNEALRNLHADTDQCAMHHAQLTSSDAPFAHALLVRNGHPANDDRGPLLIRSGRLHWTEHPPLTTVTGFINELSNLLVLRAGVL